MMKISVVTVNYGDVGPLLKTLKSVDDQDYYAIESVVVASSMNEKDKDIIMKEFVSDNRKFILNKDSSLYDAMNLGLNAVSGDAVIFLNSGDIFSGSDSCSKIANAFQFNVCVIFRTLQVFSDLGFVRPKLSRLELLRFSPGHQGFVAPLPGAKNFQFEHEKYPVGADSVWMQSLISRFGYKLEENIISQFELGGLSNLPNLKLAKLKYKERGLVNFMKVILKIFMVKVLGKKNYYKLIFLKKYDVVKLK